MAITARTLHFPTPPKPSGPSSHQPLIPSHIRLHGRSHGHHLAASSSDLTSFPSATPTPNGVYVPLAAAHPAATIDVDAATEAELRENGFWSTRRTKLVCTVGPATCGAAEIEALAVGGMNVARVNMCHGDRELHLDVIRVVRRLNDEKGFAVAIMMDTEGIEIHMGDLGGATSLKAEEYYDELIESKKHDGIRVTNSCKHGKGVCANKDFDEEDLVLKDQMLVGAQHSLNKLDCVVCSYCFRFIGSVEFQIG